MRRPNLALTVDALRAHTLVRCRMGLYGLVAFALVMGSAASLGACGDDSTEAGDTGGDTGEDDAATADVDATDTDNTTGDSVSDAHDSDANVSTGPPRLWKNRAIGGMSMGAIAIDIALKNPGTFDMVGALGGYADLTYMMGQMTRLQLGGFCSLEALEGRGDALNDPAASPPVTCPPAPAKFELEYSQQFNAFHYDDNGLDMHRGLYAAIISNFSIAYGNMAVPGHADSPFLPAGIDADWFWNTPDAQRCANPKPIDARYAWHWQYNPLGAYDVIPLCDHKENTQPGVLSSVFDPQATLNMPIPPLLAVDINGNGRRDLGEPVMLKPWERYSDVGLDGCANDREDGAGGCIADTEPAAARPAQGLDDDPNGDDYDWRTNPGGSENNDGYDVGEPFIDLGLDGVDAAVSGFSDEGEGNGVWDAVAAMDNVLSDDADSLVRAADAATLATTDFWFDGGIRDALGAAVSARNIVAALRVRDQNVTTYTGFSEQEGAIFPDRKAAAVLQFIGEVDLRADAIGRNVYVEYGDPDATDEEIALGDGKHVGRGLDAVNRLSIFIAAAMQRFPDGDRVEGYEIPSPVAFAVDYYSQALAARRTYTIALPPGYDAPENADKTYPVLLFLHGLGQDASDLAAAGLGTSLLMTQGKLPKAILAFPDGGCCFANSATGQRECACGGNKDGARECIDPTCTDAAQSCETRQVPDNVLQRECQKGSLYANMVTNRWGEPRTDMNYQDAVMEVMRDIETRFRARPAIQK